jgi:hypothetical protein
MTMPVAAPGLKPAELQQLFASELGDKWKPELLPKLQDAHQLMEQYFATTRPADRKGLVSKIDQIGLDPGILGRTARIREKWPELKPGVYYVYDRVGPNPVAYFVGVPNSYVRTKSWPLVLCLSDVNPFLDANGKALNLSPEVILDMHTVWIQKELEAHPDAVTLMPLLDLYQWWGPGYQGMSHAMQPLFHVQDRLNIDPAQVYMVGYSMSSEAAWNLAMHYPTYFSAIMPLAGVANIPFVKIRRPNLRNIASFVWHDADDKVANVQTSRDMVRFLRDNKFAVEYKETTKQGHIPPTDVILDLYKKMRAVKRDLYPKEVQLSSNRPDTQFNRSDWIQVYQILNPGRDETFAAGIQGIVPLVQNNYSLSAKNDPARNRIDVTAKNAQCIRFYLNDQMLDLSKPITITYNGATRFDGKVQPSTETMLAAQLNIYRGWRYYTAYAEIDFGASVPSGGSATTRPTPSRGRINYVP